MNNSYHLIDIQSAQPGKEETARQQNKPAPRSMSKMDDSDPTIAELHPAILTAVSLTSPSGRRTDEYCLCGAATPQNRWL
jgi:hypothetical protein